LGNTVGSSGSSSSSVGPVINKSVKGGVICVFCATIGWLGVDVGAGAGLGT